MSLTSQQKARAAIKADPMYCSKTPLFGLHQIDFEDNKTSG